MKILQALHLLLHPQVPSCLRCEREIRPSSQLAAPIPVRHPEARAILGSLCPDCLRQIPWIITVACATCGRPERCGDCLRMGPGRSYIRCRSAVRYDAAMKEWLAFYKYRGAERLEPVLSAMLGLAVERLTHEHGERSASAAYDLITAVPVAEERLMDRGFNQAERLAVRMSAWYGIPYRSLLQRRKHTEKQSLKNRRGRIEDLRDVFQARPELRSLFPSASRKLRILLVDDIYTTGSTIRECTATMMAANPAIEVYGALWARS